MALEVTNVEHRSAISVARLLSVSEAAMRKFIGQKRLHAVHIRSRVLIPMAAGDGHIPFPLIEVKEQNSVGWWLSARQSCLSGRRRESFTGDGLQTIPTCWEMGLVSIKRSPRARAIFALLLVVGQQTVRPSTVS
jgi:hypothetical protein